MKRMGLVFGLTLSVAMLLSTVSVLIRPVFAESCSAKCRNGGSVTCYGFSCTATDYDGCSSYDQNKNPIIQLSCNREEDELL